AKGFDDLLCVEFHYCDSGRLMVTLPWARTCIFSSRPLKSLIPIGASAILRWPNDKAHPRRPLVRRNAAKNRNAAAVGCSDWLGEENLRCPFSQRSEIAARRNQPAGASPRASIATCARVTNPMTVTVSTGGP